MANSLTEHSKQLRRAAANRRIERICSAGGKRISVLLRAPAYANLRSECTRTGLKEGAVIEKMLLEIEKKS